MTTVLVCLSITLLLAGIVIAVLPSASKGNHSITIKNDQSVVTVRSAGSSDISISFDPAELGPGTPPMELSSGMEDIAEGERTVLDELLDPGTPIERKRQIARTLRELKYDVFVQGTQEDAPVGTQPEATWEEAEGCDESMVQPEPDEYID